MSTRHTARNFRRVPQRRKLVWARSGFGFAAQVNGVANVQDLMTPLKAAGSSVLGATVMRIHARLEITPGSAVAGSHYWYGFKVSDANELTGTTLLPSQNNELDWMLLDRLDNHFTGATIDSTQHAVVDLKSRRKFEEMGQTIAFYAENESGATATWNAWISVLIALP